MSARRAARWSLVIVVLASAVASGCGGSSTRTVTAKAPLIPTPPSSARQAEQSSLRASIAMQSAAKTSSGRYAPRFTCKGANESIPLAWAGVAPSAKELVVLVRSFGTGGLASPNINWLVAGISPSVQSIAAGKLPAGTTLGRNYLGQNGYSLCPIKGSPRTIVSVDVLAYPKHLTLKPGFKVEEIGAQVKGGGVQWGSMLGYVS
jgi:phosphatidylethanolamine-binding protein (PEBP) family uncharacterized protein